MTNSLVAAAILTLANVIRDPNAPPQIRVLAANTMLRALERK